MFFFNMIFSLLYFIFIFVLFYHFLRIAYYFLVKIFLTRIFDGNVKFTHGYSFFSIRNLVIKNDNFEMHINMAIPSFGRKCSIQYHGVHIKMEKPLEINRYLNNFKDFFGKINATSYFFHLTYKCDEITIEYKKSMLQIHGFKGVITDSLFSIHSDIALLKNKNLEVDIRGYESDFHFDGPFPESIKLIRPTFNITCKDSTIILDETELIGFCNSNSIWRFSLHLISMSIVFKNLKPVFFMDSRVVTLTFTEFIDLHLYDRKVIFNRLDCSASNNIFSLNMTNTTLSFSLFQFDCCTFHVSSSSLKAFNEIRNIPFLSSQNLAFNKLQMNIYYGNIISHRVRITVDSFHKENNSFIANDLVIDLLSNNMILSTFASNKCHFYGLDEMKCDSSTLKIFSISEQIKRFYLVLISETDFHQIYGKKVKFSSNNAIVERRINELRIEFTNIDGDISLKNIIQEENAKKFISSTFPNFVYSSGIKHVTPLSFKFKCSSALSANGDLRDCKFRGQLGTIYSEVSFNLFFIVYSKIKTAKVLINNYYNRNFLFYSFIIKSLELIFNEKKYTVMNARGDNNEVMFDKIEVVKITNNQSQNSNTNQDAINYRINGSSGILSLIKQKIKTENVLFCKSELFSVSIKLDNLEPVSLKAKHFEVAKSPGLSLEYNLRKKEAKVTSLQIPSYSILNEVEPSFTIATIQKLRMQDTILENTKINNKKHKITVEKLILKSKEYSMMAFPIKLLKKNDLWSLSTKEFQAQCFDNFNILSLSSFIKATKLHSIKSNKVEIKYFNRNQLQFELFLMPFEYSNIKKDYKIIAKQSVQLNLQQLSKDQLSAEEYEKDPSFQITMTVNDNQIEKLDLNFGKLTFPLESKNKEIFREIFHDIHFKMVNLNVHFFEDPTNKRSNINSISASINEHQCSIGKLVDELLTQLKTQLFRDSNALSVNDIDSSKKHH